MVYGSSYDENSFQVDGVDITDNYFNEALAEPNTDAIEEVEVLSLGAPAEYGNLTGAVYNIVTRQGTNEFHGDVNFFCQTDGLTVEQHATASSTPTARFLNACSDGVGRCPWTRDKYTRLHRPARRARSSRTSCGSSPPTRTSATTSGTWASTHNDPLPSALRRPTATSSSSTGRSAPSHKLVGTFHLTTRSDDNGLDAELGARARPSTRRGKTPTPGLAYTGVLSDKTVAGRALLGLLRRRDGIGPPTPTSRATCTRFYDIDTGVISGGHYYWYELEPKRTTVTAKVSHLADKFLGASHDFRFGVQYSDAEARGIYGYNDLVYTYSQTAPDYGYGYRAHALQLQRRQPQPSASSSTTRSASTTGSPSTSACATTTTRPTRAEQDELDEIGKPTGDHASRSTDYYTWKHVLAARWASTGS